ncbi:hypothetical protein LINPERPRIM_LOCUS13392 [Linum perenne]
MKVEGRKRCDGGGPEALRWWRLGLAPAEDRRRRSSIVEEEDTSPEAVFFFFACAT